MTPEDPKAKLARSRLWRGVYIALGLFFVGLGVLGMFLPVLPTTPFLLLASFFFIRSSPALYNRLLRAPILGKFLRDWEEHRGVTVKTKIVAIAVILAAVAFSIWLGDLLTRWPLLIAIVVLAGVGVGVVIRLPMIQATKRFEPLEPAADLTPAMCPVEAEAIPNGKPPG